MLAETQNPGVLRVWETGDPQDRAAWQQAWAQVADGNIFYHPAYLEQVAEPGEVPCCAAYTSTSGEQLLYPFLRRRIYTDNCGHPVEPGSWDIYTPLLYGGPLAPHMCDSSVAKFWPTFQQWARRAGIVSEFIRMSPLAAHRLPYPGTLRQQAPHIVRDLTAASAEELLQDMHPTMRRGRRKAQAAGLTISVDETGQWLDSFLRIHHETMARTGAADRFYMRRETMESLQEAFPGRLVYIYALYEHRPVAVELIVLSDTGGYFFLGGTETAALALGGSVLVHVEAIRWAWQRGLKWYVLTGGVHNTADDSLLRFKKKLAPRGSRDYLTAQQVFDTERYEQLICCPPEASDADFFPTYRASPLEHGSWAHALSGRDGAEW